MKWRLIVGLVTVLCFGFSQAEEETPENVKYLPADEPHFNKDFHDVYMVNDEAYVTPKTHPGLFSFTGRWIKRREAYIASQWPGTSVAVLIYGEKCRVTLESTRKGVINNHEFTVIIDQLPPSRITLPSYNSSASKIFEFELSIPPPSLGIQEAARGQNLLMPHIVELVSEPSFPLRLVGVSMENVLINQGAEWVDRRNEVPIVEFVSDRLPDAPQFDVAPHVEALRAMGLRHSHVEAAGFCFTEACPTKQAGLSRQYAFLSPFYGNPVPKTSDKPIPIYWVFHRDQPFYNSPEPSFVVVDVGVNDLIAGTSGEEFMRTLQMFLANLIAARHKDSEVYVLIRKDRYVEETEAAILSLRSSKIHAVSFGHETVDWYKSFLCTYVVSVAKQSYPYRELCGEFTGYANYASSLGKVKSSNVTYGFFGTVFVLGTLIYLANHRTAVHSIYSTTRSNLSGYVKIPTYGKS